MIHGHGRPYMVGSPSWSNIPVSDGRFEAGTAGTDHLAGQFYGPEHEESYGTFDISDYVGTYVGAFGARRQ